MSFCPHWTKRNIKLYIQINIVLGKLRTQILRILDLCMTVDPLLDKIRKYIIFVLIDESFYLAFLFQKHFQTEKLL